MKTKKAPLRLLIFSIVFIFILCSTVSSFGSSSSMGNEHPNAEQSEISEKDVGHDSRFNQPNSQKKIINPQRYEQVEAAPMWLTILTLGIAIIGILLNLLVFVQMPRLKGGCCQNVDLENDLSFLKNKHQSFQNQLDQLKTLLHQKSVSTPEQKVPTLNRINKSPQSTIPHAPAITPLETRTAYFKDTYQDGSGHAYFNKLYDLNDGSYFKAKTTGNSAEFEPSVSLNTCKSMNFISEAVEFVGVSLNDATSMQLKSPGIASKSGDKWKIIKKAVVELA